MASNKRVPYFAGYAEAKRYAQLLADRCRTGDRTRYVAPAGARGWAVGTKKQLEDLGLGLLVPLHSRRKVRMKGERQREVYTYWRQNGDVRKTAQKFDTCPSNVYRIIKVMKDKS